MAMRTNQHHNVYVVRLDPAVLEVKKFRDANPAYIDGKPCVYVGMTGLTPGERFDNHKRGYKANRFVRKYGLYLMRQKFERLNPMSWAKARRMEEKLAEKLRAKGFAVWQG
jgi:hypothetical protein